MNKERKCCKTYWIVNSRVKLSPPPPQPLLKNLLVFIYSTPPCKDAVPLLPPWAGGENVSPFVELRKRKLFVSRTKSQFFIWWSPSTHPRKYTILSNNIIHMFIFHYFAKVWRNGSGFSDYWRILVNNLRPLALFHAC